METIQNKDTPLGHRRDTLHGDRPLALAPVAVSFRVWHLSRLRPGTALVSTGAEQYTFDEQTELIFLTGSLIHVLNASDDFRARVLLFPKGRLPHGHAAPSTPLISTTRTSIPATATRPTTAARRRGAKSTSGWTSRRCSSPGRSRSSASCRKPTSCRACSSGSSAPSPKKSPRASPTAASRWVLRFMQLVREYGTREHRVEFYADRLCITPRYLHRAMVEH